MNNETVGWEKKIIHNIKQLLIIINKKYIKSAS